MMEKWTEEFRKRMGPLYLGPKEDQKHLVGIETYISEKVCFACDPSKKFTHREPRFCPMHYLEVYDLVFKHMADWFKSKESN